MIIGTRGGIGFIPPTAICRHRSGDPNCGSSHPFTPSSPVKSSDSPDASNYEVEEIERVGPHVVMKVRYPNCKSCAFEGNKVMVFLNVTEKDILRWRKIDPHFRAPVNYIGGKEAPSPAARFPATDEGWGDAVAYATRKDKTKVTR